MVNVTDKAITVTLNQGKTPCMMLAVFSFDVKYKEEKIFA